jgi:HK97 family phage major capsid protein/HK97 family phage prohead protease
MKKRAWSTLTIKSFDDKTRRFKGIASTPETDRDGDIVEPKGAVFKLPLPFLWQHDSRDPVGWIDKAKVTKNGIQIEGEVATVEEPGALKDRLEKAWQMLKTKLVRGLSIGFNGLETARIGDTYGIHFIKWEWLELSAVTIAANQNASITSIKSIDRAFLAASGIGPQSPGASGNNKSFTQRYKENGMKTLKELQEEREQKRLRLQEIKEGIDGENRAATAEEAQELDTLMGEMKDLDDEIRMKMVDEMSVATAKPVSNAKSFHSASQNRGGLQINMKKTDVEEKFKGQNYTRMVIAKAIAALDGISPLVVAQRRGWHQTNPLLFGIMKAAVEGGGSGSGEWGAELVQADTTYTGDFIEYLKSKTVYDALPLREVPANIMIKGQDGTATGYWVGESKAIPAGKADFSDVSLTPLKVAALAVVSNELLRDSTPSAEKLVRDSLVDASTQRIDTTFLSTSAAVAGVSPAGLLNGVSGQSSSGNDGDGVAEDIKTLYDIFITALNASGLQLVMNPALAKAIQLMRNTLGIFEFPGITQDGGTLLGDPVKTGDNVNSAHMILLKPSDIFKIGDTGVEVSISREAMIEMDDAPAMDSQTPTTASGAVVSMFQTESTAIKVVRSINFAKRRSGAVQYISDAAYGTTGS